MKAAGVVACSELLGALAALALLHSLSRSDPTAQAPANETWGGTHPDSTRGPPELDAGMERQPRGLRYGSGSLRREL